MIDDQSNYICNDDDLNSLTDYFTAALAGEESKFRLLQMWEREIRIIKATRMGTDARRAGKSPICKICTSGEQEPFCVGCERLREHDTAIRGGERKRLLRLIKEWQRKHCYWFTLPHTDGEQRYHFDPAAFKEFLESLAATDPTLELKNKGGE